MACNHLFIKGAFQGTLLLSGDRLYDFTCPKCGLFLKTTEAKIFEAMRKQEEEAKKC